MEVAGGITPDPPAVLAAHRALQAAEALAEEGIEAEVVDLRWLAPIDAEAVLQSVRRTHRVVIVQEGAGRGGWGATVAAAVAEGALDALQAPIIRLTGPDEPIPFAPHLEAQYVPTAAQIAAAARRLVRGGAG
jgi:pyruvate dehydrogenase E1 component beta subunit